MPELDKKLIIAFEYFIQGLSLALPFTIILTYKEVPSYLVLCLFEMARFAFAVKFLIAPLVETYTSIDYGKRKTWIMATCLAMTGTAFLLSFVTEFSHIIFTALLAIPHVFLGATQDVSLDALAVKELERPEDISFLQSVAQRFGWIFGSFVFLKLTSTNFGIKHGFEEGIMQVPSFVQLIACVILVVTLLFHFTFQETSLETEVLGRDQTLLDNLKHYNVFFDSSRREYRQAIFFIVVFQGCLFYNKSYQIELMKGGQSKETLNEFNNYFIVPIMIVAYLYSKLFDGDVWAHLRVIIGLRFGVSVIGYVISPTSYLGVLTLVALNDLLWFLHCLVDNIIINNFPLTRVSGMTICMLNSCRNFGDTSVQHMFLIQYLGFSFSSILGFAIQAVIMYKFKELSEWVQAGSLRSEEQEKYDIE